MDVSAKINQVLNCPESVDLIFSQVHSIFSSYCRQMICPELRPYVILSGGSIVKTLQDFVIEAVRGYTPTQSMTFYSRFDLTTSKNTVHRTDVDFFIWKKPPMSAIRAQYNLMKMRGISLKKIDKSQYFTHGKKRRALTVFDQEDMIQFIPHIQDHPTDVVKHFDFEHLKIYYDCRKDCIKYDDDILQYICFGDVVRQDNQAITQDRFDKWEQHMEYYRRAIGL
jgi:hypothetical protein